MAALSEDLELNIAPAIAAVEQLASALDTALQSVGPSLSEALSTAIGGLDTSALANLPLGADGSAITAEGEAAVQAIDPTVTLVADTADLIAQGDAAMQSVVEAQVSNVIQGVGNTQGIIASGAEVAGVTEGVNALTGATKGLQVANAGLEGSVSGVTSAFGPLGVAIAGTTAIAATFFTEAVNEETALNRLKLVFGDLADSIQQVNLPANNFNLSFQQIATTTGASLPGLEQAVSRVGAIGTSAGAAAPQIAETAKQIVAIATYLAVTNPALGSADQIVNQLTNTLQRGGRAASLLGLSLPTAELNAAAQAAVGTGNQVSQFDKIAAGAKIVSDQLGVSLGTAVTAGANEAALALPKLKETLKETIAALGEPLIGPITKVLSDIGPPLEQIATAIGRLLQAAAPLAGVLGILLRVLGDLASIIIAIPLPILTTAVEAFTAALVIDKVSLFAAGLFTLGANATADVGAVGLLTGAVDGLLTSLGPVGIAIAALGALQVVSQAAASANTEAATKMAQAVAGIKAGTDLAKESASQLQGALDAVNNKLSDIKKANPSGSDLVPTVVSVDGQTRVFNYTDAVKALTGEATTLKAAQDKAKTSTDSLAGSDATAAKTAKEFGDAISAQAAKLGGVAAAMASVEAKNASLVSTAIGKMPGVAGVFGDVSTAIDEAAKASEKQASSSGSASSAMAEQATHAKDLRDATASLAQAQEDFNTLAAGPTTAQIASGLLTVESAAKGTRDALQSVDDATAVLATLAAGPSASQLAAGYLTIEQAARSMANAQQAVVDAQTALNLLAAGPSADSQAQAQENVSKAQLNRQKAVLALSDAIDAQNALIDAGTATDRQTQDAQTKVTEAQFALTDASRSLNDAIAVQQKLTTDSIPGSVAMTAAQNKLRDAQLSLESAQTSQQAAQAAQNKLITDSLPGSRALTDAQNKLSDAQLSLAQAQETQAAAQSKQDQLFSDALPGSAAYTAALGKVADAQDHLTQVVESGNAKSAASAAASAKTHVDALQALSDGLDKQIDAENKFFTDLEKIQAEGGMAIVAELLAQGPKQGAAAADAVANATPAYVTALEKKAETLKADETRHAKEIGTLFGASLNQQLLDTFQTQLTNETDFYTNVQKIFDAGNTTLATNLLNQGPVQGGALAAAVVNATPQVQHEIEVQADKFQTAENEAGKRVGGAFGDGIVTGLGAKLTDIAAAGAVGGAALNTGAVGAIQAHSPSRLAMKLGGDWAEGLALGVIGGIPLVSDAATRLAGALSPAVFTSLNDLLASSVQIASGAAAASLSAAAVAIPSQANASATALAAVGAATPGTPGIINNFNLPAGITDPQGIALAVSARQALQATR